jgi:legumain
MNKIFIVAALCLTAIASANAASWAVIVAGSNTYSNYRHQADACHAYHIVKNNGIPEERIIIMHYDDIAHNSRNPFQGQVFNKPTAAGTPGVDVYAGCGKDYTGSSVTADNFINVITGNAAAVKGGNGKVLKSGPEDNVFIYFTDHGGPNIIAFPVGPYLQSSRLNSALKQMYDKKMYKKLVFYLEACESGSMFAGLLPSNINVYATTAANPTESSWGFYCPPQDKINGKSIGSCLGDEYSIQWMEDTDNNGVLQSLATQFTTVKAKTLKSHVMQYGDVSFTELNIGQFQGEKYNTSEFASPFINLGSPVVPATQIDRDAAGAVPSRDIPMHLAYYRYLRADKSDLAAQHEAASELLAHINGRVKTDKMFMQIAASFVPGNVQEFLSRPSANADSCGSCCEQGHAAVERACGGYGDSYGMNYIKVVNNICALNANHVSFGTVLANKIASICA